LSPVVHLSALGEEPEPPSLPSIIPLGAGRAVDLGLVFGVTGQNK
jgi:hypothetical protein